MDPTLYAGFRDANAAELAFNALLDLGVQPEDLSLLVNELAHGGPPPGPQIEGVETTVEFDRAYDPATVGRLDDLNVGEMRFEEEVSDRFESRVGGGISTSTRDDSVDSIDQMDDGQSAAEDMIHPEGEESYSSQERHDVTEAATTGYFNTTAPERDSLTDSLGEPRSTVEVDSITVHGLGRVVGDGQLATLATGAAVAAATGGRSAAQVGDYLSDAGVPKAEVAEFSEPFTHGGAILAATIRPGDARIEVAEEIIARYCPEVIRTYNDIPEPNGLPPSPPV